MYRQDLFSFTLSQLRNGKTQEQLSEKLNDVIQACRDTGQKGAVQLTIIIRPDKGDSGQYFLRPEIKVKKPEFAPSDNILGNTRRQLATHRPRARLFGFARSTQANSRTKAA